MPTMAKKLMSLNTVEAVIEALGGIKEVQRLTWRDSNSAVPMWKTRGKFPPNTYTVMQKALRQKRMTAPDHLWGML